MPKSTEDNIAHLERSGSSNAAISREDAEIARDIWERAFGTLRIRIVKPQGLAALRAEFKKRKRAREWARAA